MLARRQIVMGAAATVGSAMIRPLAAAPLDLTVAITAGNYADQNQWMPPIRVIREVVLSSLL
ncbi:MAG TPA: hypothetical protein VNC42_04380 [Bradyrhizobium sp.]|nr:hypothetical protein [Bradyrhizobium sp.]